MITETTIGNTALVFVAVLFVKEFFNFLKWIWSFKNKKNENEKMKRKEKTVADYEQDLNSINVQLSNHMNDMAKDITKIQTDMKIVIHDINEVKIAVKR